MSKPQYTIVIQWDDESDCYVASLPEWGPYCKAYGDTYQEVVEQAAEIIDLLMDRTNDPDPLPEPVKFVYPGSNVVPMPDPLDNPPPLRKPAKEKAGV